MRSERPNEIRVGLFIATALALGLLAIWSVGSAQNLLVRRDPFFISVPNAAGIAPGAKVTISGVSAGTVDSFSLKHEDQNVRVHLSISSQLEEFIKKDSFAEVITEGVLGDKLIAIAAGSSSSPRLQPGSEIPTHRGSSLQALLGKSDRLASELSVLTGDVDQLILLIAHQLRGDHLATSLRRIDNILGKIDQGNGTLGGLVNDPKLLDDVKALLGETNENRIVRNIVRKTVKDSEEKKRE